MTGKGTINRTVKLMLTMFGVWPGISCVALYRVFWLVTLAINEFFHYRYIVTHLHIDNLFNLMDCLSSFLAHVKLTVKLVVLSLKQRKFIEILTTIAEDWRDCSNGDGDALRETARKTKLSSRICNGLIILHTIAAVMYVIGILLADVDVTDRTTELPLMMRMEYPFVIDTQRKYRLVLATQFVFVMVCSWGAGLFNALLLTLTLHVGGQMNILLCRLTEAVSRENEKRRESIVVLTKIIRKHQQVINFSENIESLYSQIALVQFASNTVMICSLGFLIVTAIGNPDATEQIVRSLLFYAVTNLEAFIFCFAGEYLMNKSKAIGNAAYNSAWYDMRVRDSRVLLFVILRSQRHLTLTAGKMMDLSLESFTNIMKASGSYLSVLLAMK